jgi:hypothetical protein
MVRDGATKKKESYKNMVSRKLSGIGMHPDKKKNKEKNEESKEETKKAAVKRESKKEKPKKETKPTESSSEPVDFYEEVADAAGPQAVKKHRSVEANQRRRAAAKKNKKAKIEAAKKAAGEDGEGDAEADKQEEIENRYRHIGEGCNYNSND